MKTGHDMWVVEGVVGIIAKGSDNLVEKPALLVLRIDEGPICDVLIRTQK